MLDCEKHTPEQPYAILQIPAYTAVKPDTTPLSAAQTSTLDKLSNLIPALPAASLSSTIAPVPLTRESFARYGEVIQAYPEVGTRWDGMDIQAAPDGMTTKYARLANITNSYPADAGAITGISVFRATPKIGLERGKAFDIRYMERHPYTSQAFVPMGKGEVSPFSHCH